MRVVGGSQAKTLAPSEKLMYVGAAVWFSYLWMAFNDNYNLLAQMVCVLCKCRLARHKTRPTPREQCERVDGWRDTLVLSGARRGWVAS